ncbi:MAG: coproporphyrinogen III oxidase family protein [Bacteriovoracaceae bacterium]|nr:coproporphyrinogen III oxidase family protein [Bacteriovoracaceae bacterium]
MAGLYLHFPYCRRCCAYCDFFKRPFTANSCAVFGQYLQEIINHPPAFLESSPTSLNKLDSLYFGGGSPSLAPPELIQMIQKLISRFSLGLAEEAEVTLEVNPEDIPQLAWDAWRALGVNRLSFGLQSMDPKMRAQLGRNFDEEKLKKFLQQLPPNFNYSFDLLLGLPFAPRDLRGELNRLLDLNPHHLSTYILTPPPHLTWPKAAEESVVEDFLLTDEVLTKAGFKHYEVSNYAREGYASVHNLKYWHLKPVLAFGPTAVGLRQKAAKLIRYRWPEDFSNRPQEEELSSAALHLERLYLALRLAEGIDLADHFSPPQQPKAQQVLQRYPQDVIHTNGRWQLTPAGMLRMDGLVVELAALLPQCAI